MNRKIESFVKLLEIMDQLREKCPWDRKQTFESLRTLTIEEAYELADAIQKGEPDGIKKELGDVLLHIVFYSKIASEQQTFDIADVMETLVEKLIYRHPHVFGEQNVSSEHEVASQWEKLKLKEKDGNKSVLSGIPGSLPALIKAYRIQDKARGVGFDWEHREQVWDKVAEELGELRAEIESMNTDKQEEEFGDLLFSIINAARLFGINPENALESTNQKFIRRFNYLEARTIGVGKNLKEMSLAEMDRFWEEAKKAE